MRGRSEKTGQNENWGLTDPQTWAFWPTMNGIGSRPRQGGGCASPGLRLEQVSAHKVHTGKSQTGSLCRTSGRVSGSGTPCVYEWDALYNTLRDSFYRNDSKSRWGAIHNHADFSWWSGISRSRYCLTECSTTAPPYPVVKAMLWVSPTGVFFGGFFRLEYLLRRIFWRRRTGAWRSDGPILLENSPEQGLGSSTAWSSCCIQNSHPLLLVAIRKEGPKRRTTPFAKKTWHQT